MKAVFLAVLQGRAVPVGVCGGCWALVELALVTWSCRASRILLAEEDRAISQCQLEMTVKTEIIKCDKLME